MKFNEFSTKQNDFLFKVEIFNDITMIFPSFFSLILPFSFLFIQFFVLFENWKMVRYKSNNNNINNSWQKYLKVISKWVMNKSLHLLIRFVNPKSIAVKAFLINSSRTYLFLPLITTTVFSPSSPTNKNNFLLLNPK